MGMNKNTVLGWATFIMILMGLLLIALALSSIGMFRMWDSLLSELFLANAWVLAHLRVGFKLYFKCLNDNKKKKWQTIRK
jgi:hypothetical protein